MKQTIMLIVKLVFAAMVTLNLNSFIKSIFINAYNLHFVHNKLSNGHANASLFSEYFCRRIRTCELTKVIRQSPIGTDRTRLADTNDARTLHFQSPTT